MKKLPSTLTNMVLVLTGITVVMIGLLAFVNSLTEEPIRQASQKALQEAVGAVLPEYDNDPIQNKYDVSADGSVFTVYPGYKDGDLVGAAGESSSLGFGGELRVLVGFNAKGDIVDYSLLSHSETPGLGAKASSWFKKGQKGDITGLNPSEKSLTVSKDGGQVDAITASTITSRAFLNAVNMAYGAFSGNLADTKTAATQSDSSSSATPKAEGAAKSADAASGATKQQPNEPK